MSGYYMTNINITGQSEAHPSLILDRSSNTQILDHSFGHTSGPYVEDHGIYASGFYDMESARNTLSGWSLYVAFATASHATSLWHFAGRGKGLPR